MTSQHLDEARKRLILALDVPDMVSGTDLLDEVKGQIGLVKVGLELFAAVGPAAVQEVKKRGFDVFLDLKLHDIPNTVAGAVRAARSSGVAMLTVHTGGGFNMLERAAQEAGALRLLGVTLLTSLGVDDLDSVAIKPDPNEVVRCRASLAAKANLYGIVCSPKEIRMVREVVGPKTAIVTPGIRPAGAAADDQKRAATPESAIADGADYLVVGRPIRAAQDPRTAAAGIVEEIAAALAAR